VSALAVGVREWLRYPIEWRGRRWEARMGGGPQTQGCSERVTLRADPSPKEMLRIDGDPWVIFLMPVVLQAHEHYLLDGDLPIEAP